MPMRQGPADRGLRSWIAWTAVAWATAWGWGETARGQAEGTRPPVAAEESAEEANERRAVERFLALLEKSPRRGTALDRVYGFHVERGTLDGLVQGFRDRAGKDPKDGAAWMVLGLLESQRGRDAAAVEAFRAAESARADDPIASYYLGQALVLVGDNDGAAAALERAIDRKPRRTDLLEIFQALGRIYQRAQKPDRALAVWNRLEALFPADLRVQEQAASALAEEGQLDQALSRFEALATKATDPFRRVEFAAQAADLKARLGRSEPALRDYEAILGRLRPDSWLFREVRRKVEDVFLRNDDQAGLAAYYEAWVGKNPEDVEAHVRLARTLQDLGRAAESRKWYDKAIALAPTRRDLRLALVAQFEHEGKFAEAAAQYAALDKADPDNPDTLRDWGGLLLRDTSKPEADRAPAAKAVWKRLLDARPNDPVTAAQVADLYRQAGLVEDALALYRKASDLAPGNPQYVEYLGEYLHTLKRADEAQAAWAKIAEGANRTPRNLARLGEVLAGFGYTRQAVEPTREAVALEGDDFTLRLRFADLLFKVERYDDALAQLSEAGRLSEKDEEKSAVLDAELKVDQASGKLEEKAEALAKSVGADPKATTEARIRLARYQEAAGKLPEALKVAEAAVEVDPRSPPAWGLAARLRESNGDLQAAADAFRRLAEVDRRNRTEYLTNVAKLEARLGRTEEALRAGRDLIAAAPGNPEGYQFFADLCFQLNRPDEGLDALRRAARVNPNDTKVVLALAESLAGQFRTDEAIEMFWRAFDKADGLDARLGVVPRLTELYLQINQFDRLLARLRRQDEAGAPPTPQQQREQSICLAQAYASSGDIGAARSELERLLAANARDTQLLQQLSKLAEDEGDLESAARYQKQLVEVAPAEEQTLRLAQLYARAGELEEAQALWAKLAEGQHDPAKVLATIDSLLGNERPRPALDQAENLIRKDPHDWEALYRAGVALAALGDREAAAQRFRAILDQRADDDAPGAQARARSRDPKLQGAGAKASAFARNQLDPLLVRISAAYQIRAAAQIENRNMMVSQSQARTSWAPADFGQARMAALGWLLGLATKEGNGREKALVDRVRAEAEKPDAEARARWDWLYLGLVRNDNKASYEAARALARSPQAEPSALLAYFRFLPSRAYVSGGRSAEADSLPPLPPAEVDELLAAFATLRRRRPDLVSSQVVQAVDAELKRSKRDEDRDRIFREVVAGAEQPIQLAAALLLAANRPDVDALISLADRLERATSAQRTSSASATVSNSFTTSMYLAQAMGKLAEAKDFPAILPVVDHYLAGARRRHDELVGSAQGRSRLARASASGMSSPYVTIYSGGTTVRSAQMSFPTADSYLDSGALTLLRNAYEAYKRADLTSDLVSHVRGLADAAKAPEDAVYPRLALGALLWWEDDKDAALAEYAKGVEATRSDPEMTLKMADLYQQRGEPAEALALLESVRPSDNAALQRREEAVLRLAVQTGQIERAREAAERLFGLRLDADAQLRLSEQMHQLGMHESAEALLARSRRRAGNKATALVGLMLQYQKQRKDDVAAQVALQILRSSAPTRQAAGNVYVSTDTPDAARSAALQVLARSGRIDDLIRKTEEQAQRTPGSTQIRITLADYLTAANKRDRARDELKKLAEIRPDDAQLRLRIATSLSEQGQAEEALPHYEAALKKDPSLLMRNSFPMLSAYRRANKVDDLLALLEKSDLRSFGQSYQVLNLLQNLTMMDGGSRGAAPTGRDARVMAIFKKLWEAYPAERSNMFSYFSRDQFWKSPEIYDYALQSFLPDPDSGSSSPSSPWSLFEQILSYSSDGSMTSGVSRVLDMAAAQGKLGDLGRRVEALVGKLPDWAAGRAMLALIRCREGRFDEAKERLKPVLEMKESDFNSPYATWVIAAELDRYAETQPVALAFLEKSARNRRLSFSTGDYGPINRLVQIYTRDGRMEDARRVILESVKPPEEANVVYQPEYEAQMKVQALTTAGTKLVNLGFAADAAPLFVQAADAAEAIVPGGPNYVGNLDSLVKQARDGLANILGQLAGSDLAALLARMIESQAQASSPGRAGAKAGLDLVLMVAPRELDKAAVRSIYAEAIAGLAKDPKALGDFATKVEALAASRTDDLPAQVARALASLATGDRAQIDAALARLDEASAAHPLEALAPGALPNARQRAEAASQMTLWLAARACSARPGDDPARRKADPYAARAIEAGGRQADDRWILAMLREQGQWAADRGDSAAAEAAWGLMLDRILKPEPRKKATPADAAPPGATPVRPATPAPGAIPAGVGGGGVVRPISFQAPVGKSARPTPGVSPQPPGARPAGAPPRPPGRGEPGVPVLTMDRFDRAMQVARLAASNGQVGLSLRAVREALRGGPPVEAVVAPSNSSRTMIVRSGVAGAEPVDAITPRVVDHVAGLDALWQAKQAPADKVYEALRDVVLPAARPSEVFLYAPGFGNAGLRNRPRSVGAIAAAWAVRAGKADELRAASQARKANTPSELPSGVLVAMVALAQGDDPATDAALRGLLDRAKRDTLRSTAELICHAALPALDRPGAQGAALDLLDVAARGLENSNLANSGLNDPSSALNLLLARQAFKRGDAEGGRKRLASYAEANDRQIARYSGDYPLYLRKQTIASVAAEYARAGLADDLLKALGEFADAPAYSGGDPPIGANVPILARLLAGRPAQERFEVLRAWTLPAGPRRPVRLLGGLETAEPPPADLRASDPGAGTTPGSGPASTAMLLVDAARESGSLDRLAADLAPLAEANEPVENARELARVVAIARGQGESIRPQVEARLAELEKAIPRPTSGAPDPDRQAPGRPILAQGFGSPDYNIARALIGQDSPALRAVGRRYYRLIERLPSLDPTFAARTRAELGESLARDAGATAAVGGSDGGLRDWHPSAPPPLGSPVPQTWVAHQGHVAHAWGPTLSTLYYDIPLGGTYEFSVDASSWGVGAAPILLGGGAVEVARSTPTATMAPTGAQAGGAAARRPRAARDDGYTRLTVQVKPGSVCYLADGRLVREDNDPSPTSPWLGLVARGLGQSVWKNPRFDGRPTVPREIPLSHEDRLEGWETDLFGESRAPRTGRAGRAPSVAGTGNLVVAGDSLIDPDNYDWIARDGVISGRKVTLATARNVFRIGSDPFVMAGANQSRIAYARPLRDGDEVTYEFLYEPGQTEVHPSIGRLAILLERAGVRLHWMTTAAEAGSSAGNPGDVPGERGGEGPLPLKPGEWNVARLALEGDDVVVGLNGRDVYRRRLGPDDSRTFGLYHDKDRTAAKARKVVLRGRWPETIDPARLANPLAPRPGAEPSEGDRRARHAVIGEDAFSRGAEEVLGRVAGLDPAARYEALMGWVLPGPDHPVVRLAGAFTPADDPGWPKDGSPRPRVETGGELRAPALALVDAARETGKLDELGARLDAIQGADARVECGRVALLGLVQLARGDGAGASASLDALGTLIDRADPSDLGWLRWAELVLASRASANPDARPAALKRLDAAAERAASGAMPDPGGLWEIQVRHARALARASDSPGGGKEAIGANPDPAPGWSAVSHPRAADRGRGLPPSGWVVRDGTIAHQPGRGDAFLFLDTPLAGDFRVDCEVNLATNHPIQLSYGGVAVGPKADPGTSEQVTFGWPAASRAVSPPVERPADGWVAASVEAKGGRFVVSFGGRTLHEGSIPEGGDPWFALRSDARGEGSARKLRISGTPTVPESLDLFASADLAGWSALEYAETVGGAGTDWRKQGGEVIARGPDQPGGPAEESVLRYHRPMREDGEISYEFYYAPGKATAGPALGRVAFLLEPGGVKAHRLTDAPFERSGLAADNAEAAQGPSPLPLKPDAWNSVTLAVKGDVVTVSLNGQPVASSEIEPNNPRTFGFFRLAGRDEARIRNARYRGAWPRSVPEAIRADR